MLCKIPKVWSSFRNLFDMIKPSVYWAKIQQFWLENNIKPMYDPETDHRAIGLVERLILTVKRLFSYMKAHQNLIFNLRHAV